MRSGGKNTVLSLTNYHYNLRDFENKGRKRNAKTRRRRATLYVENRHRRGVKESEMQEA